MRILNFGPIWIRIQFKGYVIDFEEKKIIKNLNENIFFNYKKIVAPEEMFTQLTVSEWWISPLFQSYTFCLKIIVF